MTACLAVVYWIMDGVAAKEDPEPRITIVPRLIPRPDEVGPIGFGSCRFMAAETERTHKNVPCTWTARNRLNSGTSASAISRGISTPICVTRQRTALMSAYCYPRQGLYDMIGYR
jgi:hypothetical protein